MHFVSFLIFCIFITFTKQQRMPEQTIDVPVDDKGILDYVNWWQSILGVPTATEEPDPVIVPVDLKTCPACECGISKKTRIVGGEKVKYVNAYPWMAQLHYKKRFYCGGSLINSQYVLTAAHCVHQFDKKHITVRLMDHDRSVPNDTIIVERKVSRIVKHKSYSVATFNNDIALIKLSEEVIFNDRATGRDIKPTPVCLPVEGKSFAGQDGLVVGWGATKSGGPAANVLHQVSVPIMTNEECKKTGYGEKRITSNMMCAGLAQGGKDSCQGDSGGPLKIVSDANHHIVGVVSWGEGCAAKNYPGVYTRVNRYLNWINNNTADACPCPYKPYSRFHH